MNFILFLLNMSVNALHGFPAKVGISFHVAKRTKGRGVRRAPVPWIGEMSSRHFQCLEVSALRYTYYI